MRARPAHERYASLPWLIVTMTVAALAIGAIAARYVESRLVASKGESLALAAAEIAHKLDLLLAERYGEVLALSRAQVFRERDAATKSAYLITLLKTHPIYLWLGATDAQGRIVVATDPAAIGKAGGKSPWFRAARDTGIVHVSNVEPFEEAGGIDAISFTAPITGPSEEFHGVVTTRVGLPLLEEVTARTLRTFQARQEFGERIEYQFATATGDVFVDSDLLYKGNVNLKRLGLPSALLSESVQPGYVEEEHLRRHIPVVTGYARTQGTGEFPGLKWTVLLRIEKDDLVAPIRRVLWKLAAAWVLVWLPIFGFSLWSAARLKEEWTHAQDEHAHAATAESKYRQLVEQARDIIYRTDAQGRFTFINPTTTRIMGYSEQDMLGRRFIEFIRPDAREAAERFYGRQFVRKTPNTYHEFPAVTKDSKEIWFGQNVQVLLENDRVMGFHAVARDITERKRAEEALQQSQQRYKELVLSVDGIVWEADANTFKFSFVSPQAERILGYPIERWLTESNFWIDHVHPEDREWAMNFCVQATREKKDHEFQYRMTAADGRLVWLHDFVAVVVENDQPAKLRGLMVDITERKQAEEALRESERTYSTLLSNLPGMVYRCLHDQDYTLTFANEGTQSLTGYSSKDFLQKRINFDQIIHPDDRTAVWTQVDAALQAGLPFQLTYRIRTAAGEERWVWEQGRGIHDEAGTLLHLEGFVTDITERKRAEDSLSLFRTLLDQATDAVEIIDPATARFLDCNEKAHSVLGYTREEFLGLSVPDIDPLVPLPVFLQYMASFLADPGSGTVTLESLHRRKDGSTFPVEVNCRLVRLDREYALAIVRDITERKRTESLLAGEKRVLEMISSGTTLSTVLESIVRLVEEQRPGVLCSILLLDKNGKTLRHGVAPSLPRSYVQASDGIAIGPTAGSCGTAAFLKKPVIVSDISSDPLWATCRHLALPHGLRACWSMPIFSSDRLVLGTFAQYHRGPKSPTDDDLRLVERCCHLAGIAIERARAEDVLRNANQALRTLSRQLLQVQEDDRRAIARDLHDEIGQSLTAIKLNVERAQRTSDRTARDRIMKDCLQITDGVLNQVRDLSLDLHPSILDDLGLAYALKWYADRQAERAGLKIEVVADLSLPRLSHDIEIACFRIVQEALTNVVRHAHASRAGITLKRETATVELCIQDDGIGFAVDEVASPAGSGASIGLTSMQERAKLLGGAVRITSAPHHGTKVIATLPLPVVSSADMPAEKAPRA